MEYHRGKDESIVTIGGCPVQPVHTLPKGCMQVAAEVGTDIVSCQHPQQVILLGALPPHGSRHPGFSLKLLYRRQRVVPVHSHRGIALSRPANGSHLSYRCVPMRCSLGACSLFSRRKRRFYIAAHCSDDAAHRKHVKGVSCLTLLPTYNNIAATCHSLISCLDTGYRGHPDSPLGCQLILQLASLLSCQPASKVGRTP